MQENENANIDASLDQELHALIGDATASNDETVAAVTSSEGSEELNLEDIDAAATVASAKEAAYAEQESDSSSGTVTPITAAKTPRVSRAAGAKAFDILKSAMDDEQIQKAAMLVTGDQEDPALVDALRDTMNGLAKKVGDKASNLLRHAGNPGKLQKFTSIGLAFLQSKGEFTSKELVEHYQQKGYTIGTARSQANQLMTLFPALKVADKTGRSLKKREDSAILGTYEGATATA